MLIPLNHLRPLFVLSVAGNSNLKTHVAAACVWRYVRNCNVLNIRDTTGGSHVTLRGNRFAFHKQCAGRYVQAFNHRHRRTGTLWEGRFKSCLVATDDHLLRVYRYIERNPVRAGMVSAPNEYAWSSVHVNLGVKFDSLVAPHPCFLALGRDASARSAAYRAWLHADEDQAQLESIRAHVAQQRAYGDLRFQAMVERTFNRSVSIRSRGRPPGNSSLPDESQA